MNASNKFDINLEKFFAETHRNQKNCKMHEEMNIQPDKAIPISTSYSTGGG